MKGKNCDDAEEDAICFHFLVCLRLMKQRYNVMAGRNRDNRQAEQTSRRTAGKNRRNQLRSNN